MSRLLIVVLVLCFFSGGCAENEQPLDARCVVEPGKLEFGNILPPQSPIDRENVSRDLVISNRPERTSPSGNEDVSGTIQILLEAPQANPPDFHLVPRNTDPNFRVPARGSVTYAIEATILSTTSTGPYVGTLDLGSFCVSAAFTLHVAARPEAPPVFDTEWGGEGTANGKFSNPWSVAVAPNGDVYVLDRFNNRVQKFDSQGDYVRRWFEWDERDTDPGLTHFKDASGIAVDSQGFVYVADTEPEHNIGRVTRFDSNGNYLLHWGPAQGGTSIFDRAFQVDSDAAGHIYVLDSRKYQIRKFLLQPGTAPGYRILAEWGSQGNARGRFILPYGLAVDARNGDVYVSDAFRNIIQKFSSDGKYLLQWGGEGIGPAQFREPTGLDVDGAGNVYVTDNANQRVQKFDENGAFLTAWGIPGTLPGYFIDPLDVAVDAAGDIYVVDSNSHRVEKFNPPPSP